MKCRLSLGVLICIFFLVKTASAQEEISLEQVIALALQKNYDVQVARNVSEGASTDNQYSFGAFIPQIEATGSTVWNSTNQELRFLDESRNVSGKAEGNITVAS